MTLPPTSPILGRSPARLWPPRLLHQRPKGGAFPNRIRKIPDIRRRKWRERSRVLGAGLLDPMGPDKLQKYSKIHWRPRNFRSNVVNPKNINHPQFSRGMYMIVGIPDFNGLKYDCWEETPHWMVEFLFFLLELVWVLCGHRVRPQSSVASWNGALLGS